MSRHSASEALEGLLNPKAPSGGAFTTGILPLDDATAGRSAAW